MDAEAIYSVGWSIHTEPEETDRDPDYGKFFKDVLRVEHARDEGYGSCGELVGSLFVDADGMETLKYWMRVNGMEFCCSSRYYGSEYSGRFAFGGAGFVLTLWGVPDSLTREAV